MSISCCPTAGYMECLPMSFYDTLIHFKIIVSSTLTPCLVHSSKQLTAVCSESSALAWKYQLFSSFCRLFNRDNAVRNSLAALRTHLLSQNETVQKHYDCDIENWKAVQLGLPFFAKEISRCWDTYRPEGQKKISAIFLTEILFVSSKFWKNGQIQKDNIVFP